MIESKFTDDRFDATAKCPFVISNGVNFDPRKLLDMGGADYDENGRIVLTYEIPEDYNYYTDTGSYVKLFKTSFDVYLKLGGVARLLMQYIAIKLAKKDEWFVQLDLDVVAKELEYSSKATVYKAVIELIENNVLRRHSVKKHYWINPNYFFNGNRTEKLKGDDPAYAECRNYIKKGYEDRLKERAKEGKNLQPNEFFNNENKKQ